MTDSDVLPQKFYKFRPFDTDLDKARAKEILCDHKIFCPAPSSFNDPFDCRPCFSLEAPKKILAEDFIRLGAKLRPPTNRAERRRGVKALFADPKRDPRRPAAVRSLQNEMTDYIINKVGVLCLSSVSDDILMWSHYAGSHRGICIEFEATSELTLLANEVTYQQERSLINLYKDDTHLSVKKALLTKAEHWAYEKEWRLIDHENGPGHLHFNPKDITGVIFGSEVKKDTIVMVKEWLKLRPSLVKLYQAKADQQTFKINIKHM